MFVFSLEEHFVHFHTSVQSLIEFDSEHALDVDKAPLYPFDTYHLTSSVRIVSSTPGSGQNDSVPVTISKIATVDVTTNFAIRTEDVESYADTLRDGRIPTRYGYLQEMIPLLLR